MPVLQRVADDEEIIHMRLQGIERAIQQRATIDLDQGLVLAHARAAPPCEDHSRPSLCSDHRPGR